jgi:hypothetical protein
MARKPDTERAVRATDTATPTTLGGIVSDNLTQLMRSYCESRGKPASANLWTCELGLDSKVIHRAAGARGLTLSSIEQVAAATEVEPWHLLVKGFDPQIPPLLSTQLSPIAVDLAKTLDDIRDPAFRASAYAMALRVLAGVKAQDNGT